MGLTTRLLLMCMLLGTGWAGQRALWRHLDAAGPMAVVRLTRPLAELPVELGGWRVTDRPLADAKALEGDEDLQRTYRHVGRRQAIQVGIVYSAAGLDRGHHPEVCMSVAGQPEDPSARRPLPLPGYRAPVQQYRFGHPGTYQLVYYWYYTMPPPRQDLDPLQRTYQRLQHHPASVTVQVFAPELSADDGDYARQFVGLLDAALQKHLPATAERGSRRVPVTVIAGP
jgi:hypothetical protein